MSAANYYHDPVLGHVFVAITGMTDECVLCGCWVGDARNHEGRAGGRYDQPCRAAKAATTREEVPHGR